MSRSNITNGLHEPGSCRNTVPDPRFLLLARRTDLQTVMRFLRSTATFRADAFLDTSSVAIAGVLEEVSPENQRTPPCRTPAPLVIQLWGGWCCCCCCCCCAESIRAAGWSGGGGGDSPRHEVTSSSNSCRVLSLCLFWYSNTDQRHIGARQARADLMSSTSPPSTLRCIVTSRPAWQRDGDDEWPQCPALPVFYPCLTSWQ